MITYTATGQLVRATKFDRTTFRKIALTSGTAADKEFYSSVDLTKLPYPTFPLLVLTPGIETVKFLFAQVTGGTAVIRLTQKQGYYLAKYIDLDLSGSLLMSGVSLAQIAVIGTKVNDLLVTGPIITGVPPNQIITQPEIEPVFIEFIGMGV